MKVIYKKPIVEQIIEFKHQTDLQNKQIEYIEISRQDALLLYTETENYCCHPWEAALFLSDEEKINKIHGSLVYGIKIKVDNVEGKYES